MESILKKPMLIAPVAEDERPDPLRHLMESRQSRSEEPLDVQDLLGRFNTLQRKYDEQQALISSLERDASSDPLTGLANRRILLRELDRSLATARRYGRRHALLLIDVNDFKSINDQLGHLTGDQVLCHIARLLRQNIRPTDIAARLGGDEFCLILNELRADANAEMRATDIAQVIQRTPCIGEKHTVHLSASVGFYTFGADDNANEIIARADESMYTHKPRQAI